MEAWRAEELEMRGNGQQMSRKESGIVKVEFSGALRAQAGTHVTTTSPGLTVREAATALGVSEDQDLVAIVNGQVTESDYTLRAGDHVRLVPPISGGG